MIVITNSSVGIIIIVKSRHSTVNRGCRTGRIGQNDSITFMGTTTATIIIIIVISDR